MLKDVTDKQLIINQKITIIMATTVNNQITHKLSTTKANIWNAKRRYR